MYRLNLLLILCFFGVALVGCKQPVTYEYCNEIATTDVVLVAVTLDRGESFEGRLEIWEASKAHPREQGSQEGKLVFYVVDPNEIKVIDAGLIEGIYEFDFAAKVPGYYLLVFDDAYGPCIVQMHHNHDGTLEYWLVPYQ